MLLELFPFVILTNTIITALGLLICAVRTQGITQGETQESQLMYFSIDQQSTVVGG